MADSILAPIMPVYTAHIGAILVAGVLPVIAFFLLDGVVAWRRGRGVVPLLIAAGMVIAVASIGLLMWQGGLDQLQGSSAFPAARAGAESIAKTFVLWGFVLGAIAFLARMTTLMTGRKSRS